MIKNNLIGRRFGRLTVISENEKRCYNKIKWNCKCDCGNFCDVTGSGLITGTSQSCGCLNKERIRVTHLKHGQCGKTLEYHIWANMIQRCYNPNSDGYKYYGAKGVSVCSRWKDSFCNFFEDMGKKPSSEYSIDRIDPNKNYSPENCRWATAKTQQRNRREHVLVTIDGKTECVAYWAEITRINPKTIYARLKAGWNGYNAVYAPQQKLKRNKTVLHGVNS